MSQLFDLYALKFATMYQLAAQAKKSHLEGTMMTESGLQGQKASPVNVYGEVNYQEKDTVQTDTPLIDWNAVQRWYLPKAYRAATLTDWDQLKKVIDENNVQSGIVAMFVAAANRAKDDIAASQFFANAATGTTGTDSTSFDTTNQVVGIDEGGTNSYLNPDKIKAAIKILADNDAVLDEDLFLVINSRQNEALMKNEEFLNSDYQQSNGILIEKGLIMRAFGIEFRHLQFNNAVRYPKAAASMVSGTTDYIPVYCKSGMAFGNWIAQDMRIDLRPDKDYATQIYGRLMAGCTRTDEKKVVRIACYNA